LKWKQKLSSQKFKDRNGNTSQLSLVSKLFQILKLKMLQKCLEEDEKTEKAEERK
jgi:hypothetical protein